MSTRTTVTITEVGPLGGSTVAIDGEFVHDPVFLAHCLRSTLEYVEEVMLKNEATWLRSRRTHVDIPIRNTRRYRSES